MKKMFRAALLMLSAVVLMGAVQFPSGLGDAEHAPESAIVSGLYSSPDAGSCCWMARQAVIRAYSAGNAATLVLIFSVPNYGPFQTKSESLTLQANTDPPQTRCCYGPGQHAALFQLPKHHSGTLILHISAAVTFVPKNLGMNEDTRTLSILVRSFEYRTGSGLLLISSGSTIAQSTLMTPLLFALFALTFIVALVLAWRRPIYAIVLLILLEPFGSNVAVWLTTVSLFKTALAGTLVGFAPRAPWKELWKRREALIPIACLSALMIAALVSIVHAVYPVLVFREALKYFEYAIVFSVSFLAYRITRDRRVAGFAFAIVAIVVCIAALAQETTGSSQTAFVFGHIVPRIAGPLEGPNQLAGWLELIVPVLLCVRLQKELRALGTLALVLAIVTSLLT